MWSGVGARGELSNGSRFCAAADSGAARARRSSVFLAKNMVGKEPRRDDPDKVTGRLFIFGVGFSGLEIARLARAGGWTVAGTVTTPDKSARLQADGIETHLFDGTAPLPPAALAGATHILSS